MNHSVATDHWTLMNGIIQLSETLCFFMSRFHLQTLIIGWIGKDRDRSPSQTCLCEAKQRRSTQKGKRYPASLQRDRDHWDPAIWCLAKLILSFNWFNFSGRDHSLLPFVHHWQILTGWTTHQALSLQQHKDQDKDFSLV